MASDYVCVQYDGTEKAWTVTLEHMDIYGESEVSTVLHILASEEEAKEIARQEGEERYAQVFVISGSGPRSEMRLLRDN